MRVIAGQARGILLKTPEGLRTRPTIDRVKEAIFGSLQFDLPGSTVMDLFAGSGGLGIEALSRGAAFCQFVDEQRAPAACVRENLARTGLLERADVRVCDFRDAIRQVERTYDFVFLDPPYAEGLYQPACDLLRACGRLARGARVVAEHDGSLALAGLHEIKRRRYGKVYVSFYEREDDA